ncbi:ATP-binding protein [Micromonospora marina]|uniref:ATP-binding protein n=1 Tax=Micromonospora marina TaxID=307120 RepID=UPI003452E6E5
MRHPGGDQRTNTLGGLLRAQRHAAGLTLEDLAGVTGLSVRGISDLERGLSRSPQRRTVDALAAALRLTEDAHRALVEAARVGRTHRPAAPPGPGRPPPATTDFVGREDELTALLAHAAGTRPDDPAPVALIHGPPGLGKSSLALRVVEVLAEHYPDGRILVDLRGTEPSPMTPGEALRRLLRGLGMASGQIAADDDERASQLRATLRTRRCLVVLDNAASEAQVRHLLPGPGASLVVVTSRRPLGGLGGVLRQPLRPFTEVEAVHLLRAIAGPAAAVASAAELAEVARLCGHLPLALRIAGTRLASRPGWTVAHLSSRLSDADRRLAHLVAGDLGVEAAFALSYVQLPPPARSMFRRLSLIPDDHLGPPIAAVLGQVGLLDAGDRLDELVDLGLLTEDGPDRYRFHDLIRLYAAQRLRAEESEADREAATARMRDWLLDTATLAGRCFEPGFGTPPGDWAGMVELDSPGQAAPWLRDESAKWLWALRAAATAGQHERVVSAAEAMHWYSDRESTWPEWVSVYELSRTAAAKSGDRHLESVHLNYLAWALNTCVRRPAESLEAAHAALGIATDTGDLRLQAWALRYAGSAWHALGDDARMLDSMIRARDRFDAADDHDGYVQALVGLGISLDSLGRREEAWECYRETLDAVRQRPVAPAPALVARSAALAFGANTLGRLGRWPEAEQQARAGLVVAREVGVARHLALCHANLGLAGVATGITESTEQHLRHALELLNGPLRDRLDSVAERARVQAALAAITTM